MGGDRASPAAWDRAGGSSNNGRVAAYPPGRSPCVEAARAIYDSARLLTTLSHKGAQNLISSFYPGCLVFQRMPEYEMSARAILRVLDIELEIIQGAVCCGAPIMESFTSDWVYLSIYNLARAAEMGHDTVVTLCGSCTNALTRANIALADNAIRLEAQQRLEPLGLPLPGDIKVTHLVKILSEHLPVLRAHMIRPLQLRVALTNPCQVFRPSEVMQFDDPMNPVITRQLVELTGASIFDYDGENECCGATLYLADGKLSLAAGRRKLDATAAADALVHACGNCHLLLRHFQRAITKGSNRKPQETLFLPQLLGLAMGLPEHELGLRDSR